MRWSLRRPTGPGAAAARAAAALAVLLCLAALLGGCGSDRRQVKLMYAGSLIVPFDELAAAFEKEHPDVDVVTEAHGSIQVLRHVTELGDRMDLVASADEQLIPPLMYDRDDPATGEPWADWYCSFATNRMVLAVSPKSPLAGELTSRDVVSPAHRRPTSASGSPTRASTPPATARSWCCSSPSASTTTRTCSRTCSWAASPRPITVERAGRTRTSSRCRRSSRRAPAPTSCCAAPASSSSRCSSPATWTARSSTRASPGSTGSSTCGCRPPSTSATRVVATRTGRVRVKLDFRRFASVRPEFTGDVIRYAFTIPANAPDPELARQFAAFLLGPDGRRILEADHQPLLTPPELDDAAAAPEEVRRACAGTR